MDERNSKVRLEQSRNGINVPVVNDIYLHSIYDPIKEAESFIASKKSILTKKSSFLILGLGFGYHIDQMLKYVETDPDTTSIVILESDLELIHLFNSTRAFDNPSITILHLTEPQELFDNEDFARFLQQKPAIIKHEASYSRNKSCYQDFLSYRPSSIVSSYAQNLQATQVPFELNPNLTFKESAQSLQKQKVIHNREQYLTLALYELIEQKKEGKQI